MDYTIGKLNIESSFAISLMLTTVKEVYNNPSVEFGTACKSYLTDALSFFNDLSESADKMIESLKSVNITGTNNFLLELYNSKKKKNKELNPNNFFSELHSRYSSILRVLEQFNKPNLYLNFNRDKDLNAINDLEKILAPNYNLDHCENFA